jgi:hypothetical protein
MARQTRIRVAALATTFVAALGIIAISPATASHAGGRTHLSYVGPKVGCC